MTKKNAFLVAVALFSVVAMTGSAQAEEVKNVDGPVLKRAALEARKADSVSDIMERKAKMAASEDKLMMMRREREGKMVKTQELIDKKLEMNRGRMENFKDKSKADKSLKIVENLNKINQNLLKRFVAVTENLQKLLERADSRIAKIDGAGVNVASLKTLREKATQEVEAANRAIDAQSAKVYDTTFIESTAKKQLGAAISGLRKDLMVVHQSVLAAREAVRNLVKAIAETVPNENPAQPAPIN